MTLFRSGLANLLLQPLVGVADAFVLVWIRLTQRTHVSRDLSDLLAVHAADRHPRLLRIDRCRDPGWQRKFNGVRVAEREHDGVLPFQLSAVADADDVKFP